MKSVFDEPEELREAYLMGRDAGLNGPNTENCHFSLFATRESTNAWERGQQEGQKAKAEPRISSVKN